MSKYIQFPFSYTRKKQEKGKYNGEITFSIPVDIKLVW